MLQNEKVHGAPDPQGYTAAPRPRPMRPWALKLSGCGTHLESWVNEHISEAWSFCARHFRYAGVHHVASMKLHMAREH